MGVRFAALLGVLLTLTGCGDSPAEQAVRSDMLDPDAAQFRGVSKCTGDPAVWHGEVNGKNRLGAYTGFKTFFYAEYSVAYAEDSSFLALMNRCYGDVPSTTPSSDVAATEDPGLKDIDGSSPKAVPQAKASKAATAEKTASVTDVAPDDGIAEASACWGGYCPCDTSDPDYGYFDIPLCRKLKMGRPVSDSEFEIGAGGRDARKALREWKEDNGGSF